MSRVSRGMSFVVLFFISLISFGLKRGENGGVRFQVICRSKVKKFKKVDGDDFFPIVCCLNNCKQKWTESAEHSLLSPSNVWSRHATCSPSSRCVMRANESCEGGYASMRDLIIGIWSRALLRPRERTRSLETRASKRSVWALVLIISARFPANLSPTCLTMHTQSRSLRGGLRFTTCL